MTNHRLLTAKEVAHLLNVSERTVYRLARLGHLRPHDVAGSKRWFPADVRVYLYRLRSGEFKTDDVSAKPAKTPKRPPEGPQNGPKD